MGRDHRVGQRCGEQPAAFYLLRYLTRDAAIRRRSGMPSPGSVNLRSFPPRGTMKHQKKRIRARVGGRCSTSSQVALRFHACGNCRCPIDGEDARPMPRPKQWGARAVQHLRHRRDDCSRFEPAGWANVWLKVVCRLRVAIVQARWPRSRSHQRLLAPREWCGVPMVLQPVGVAALQQKMPVSPATRTDSNIIGKNHVLVGIEHDHSPFGRRS